MSSIKVKTNLGDEVDVPCGKCPECTARRASHWSFRLMQEHKVSMSAQFVTLTYDTKYVPISPRGFMTLNRRDVQLFMKRLRKDNTNKLKYYCVGEYGSKTWRPHYHMLLFNANIETIQAAWFQGQIHYGEVTPASVGYTLKYMCKPTRIPQHQNDDREPERALMSKGLGKSYLTDNVLRYHKENIERAFITLLGGNKISIPRYYKDKIFTEEERELIAKIGREKHYEIRDELVENEFNNSYQEYEKWLVDAKENAFKIQYKTYNQLKKD